MTSLPTSKSGVFEEGKRVRASIVCIDNEGKILIMQSKDKQNLKILGGGQEHFNGHIVHTALREMVEEVGVQCRILAQIGTFSEKKTVTTVFVAKFIGQVSGERDYKFMELTDVLISPALKDETRRYFLAYVGYLEKMSKKANWDLLKSDDENLALGILDKLENLKVMPVVIKYPPAYSLQVKMRQLSIAVGDSVRFADAYDGLTTINWPANHLSLYTMVIIDIDRCKIPEYLICLIVNMKGTDMRSGKAVIPFDAGGPLGSESHRLLCMIFRQVFAVEISSSDIENLLEHRGCWSTEKFLQSYWMEAATCFLVNYN